MNQETSALTTEGNYEPSAPESRTTDSSPEDKRRSDDRIHGSTGNEDRRRDQRTNPTTASEANKDTSDKSTGEKRETTGPKRKDQGHVLRQD